ncbi:hypothetical protein ACIRG5_42535 [Lentzea sp. NPDC102401]
MTKPEEPRKTSWFQRWLSHDDPFDQDLDPDDAKQQDDTEKDA